MFLRVKIKSLAAEAAIIRLEERRARRRGRSQLRADLHHHRIIAVRRAARHALLAYAVLRGLPYAACERKAVERPSKRAIEDNLKRFGTVESLKGLDAWLAGEKPASSAAA